MSFDQPGALDYWHSHALISGETRRDILQYCDMVSEPMRHFCGPSGGKAEPAGAASFLPQLTMTQWHQACCTTHHVAYWHGCDCSTNAQTIHV